MSAGWSRKSSGKSVCSPEGRGPAWSLEAGEGTCSYLNFREVTPAAVQNSNDERQRVHALEGEALMPGVQAHGLCPDARSSLALY